MDWKWIRALMPGHASPAHAMGLCAILTSLLAAPWSLALAALPLLLFLVVCFTAPFVPWFGFFLPVVSRGSPDKQAVAITFDDGPDPASTPSLLHLLSEHQVSATFYVTGRRAEQYPHLIRDIRAMGHDIGNHSYSHDNFIMLKSAVALEEEIDKAQQVLRGLGVSPLTFRPPVGVTSPKLNRVLRKLDMYVVNFNRRAGDLGNRRIHYLSKKILNKLSSGDIIMLHDIPLRNDKMKAHWLSEIDSILDGIRKKRLTVLPLTELLDRPIMADVEPETGHLRGER